MLRHQSHHPIPLIDPTSYRLEVCYEMNFVRKNISSYSTDYYKKIDIRGRDCLCRLYSLEQLEKLFKYHELIASLQCAGNRRKEMNDVEYVKGLQWTGGAIGNALWGGFRVREILLYDNIIDNQQSIYTEDMVGHLIMRGYDKDTNEQYETSIPLQKALDPDTIVAVNMNNSKLSRDHGFPARMIVPGVCGARSVKWLQSITISTSESKARWQLLDYKILPSTIRFGDKVDMTKYPAIQGTPVTSYICNPKHLSHIQLNESTNNNTINISGYAYSGNGNAIKNVNVSIDNGQNWFPANLHSTCDNNTNRCWSWTLWDLSIPIPKTVDHLDIIVKAIDTANNVQPQYPYEIWNMRGLLNNSWNHCYVFIAK